MAKSPAHTGVLIAILIISAWLASLVSLLSWDFSWPDPLVYLMVLVQTHLYTGLFITAHDAMHGTISPNHRLNNFIGQVCVVLYAVFPYKKLYRKHHQHHQNVHTDNDPDFYEGSFIRWYFNFMLEYLSWWQVVLMAVIFNFLKFWIGQTNLILFWVLPSLLSTLQLFYFGTWLPHHGQHDNVHQSRTQKKNHLLAFFSCYFFGYHYEHHVSPGVPWWKLWTKK